MSSDKKSFIERIRAENEQDFGPRAQKAVQKLLSSALPHPWMYVYELTQNALDAGAHRVSWDLGDDAVTMQHDGGEPLGEQHVRGISGLGGSTKGAAAVGFMGVGFKSVFSRFRCAVISGFGWRFRFDIAERPIALGGTVTQWMDALRPAWDESAEEPSEPYTTRFVLRRRVERSRPIADDFLRLTNSADTTPLAVLALRGLRELRIGPDVWLLSSSAEVVQAQRTGQLQAQTWRVFRAQYTPDDAAMRRFLEVRQETQDDLDERGNRVVREVVGLLPLDGEGVPEPPEHGSLYATLPTQALYPFGLHLQADWLVDVARQSLREICGDPWQEAIVAQVPALLRDMLVWLASQPEHVRRRGYAALDDPTHDEGPLKACVGGWQDQTIAVLGSHAIVPVMTPDAACRQPEEVGRLPGRFQANFGRRREWRPDLLFRRAILDEESLGKRGVCFATWAQWGMSLGVADFATADGVSAWWSTLPEDQRLDALLSMWDALAEREWSVPSVPTETGPWIEVHRSRWLSEEPPAEGEPGGAELLTALGSDLPGPAERMPAGLRRRVAQISEYGDSVPVRGATWVKRQSQRVDLKEVVQRGAATDGFPLVPLLAWAVNRGELRQDLVCRLLTEKGPVAPTEALLADPFVEGGASRRRLFEHLPAVSAEYATIEDHDGVLRFLERLGVRGGVRFERRVVQLVQDRSEVAAQLEIATEAVSAINSRESYRLIDLAFPFEVPSASCEDLEDWLARGHANLRGKGHRWAEGYYYGCDRRTEGKSLCSWVHDLQQTAWVLCQDGQRRAPGDVLLEPDPDREGASIANIERGLADRLKTEGVVFGARVPRSPAVRRLMARGSSLDEGELGSLLSEVALDVEEGRATGEECAAALERVRVRGVPLDRVVRRTGSGARIRGDLGGWVVSLAELPASLAGALVLPVLGLQFAETTTGRHALARLTQVWEERPTGSVEALRRHLAGAYRYVLDDVAADQELARLWDMCRGSAQLFGNRAWQPLSPELVVVDVPPVIRRRLLRGRVSVASSHLGDSDDQIRSVADALGLARLSREVNVERGRGIGDPTWAYCLRRLLTMLGSLEGARPIERVCPLDRLDLVGLDGRREPLHAYIDDGVLSIAGEPRDFAAEAASQIVEHFQMSQRGSEVPFLATALMNLTEPAAFERDLEELAESLGLECPAARSVMPDVGAVDDGSARQQAYVPGAAGVGAHAKGGGSTEPPRSLESAPSGVVIDARAEGSAHGETRSTRVERPDEVSGIDGFGVFVRPPRAQATSVGPKPSGEAHTFRADDKQRAVAAEYERLRGREPTLKEFSQKGYDLESIDASRGVIRRIEVKGMANSWKEDGDASVVLSQPQFDGARAPEDGVEYWLYVVDMTQSDAPRVFPLPWPRVGELEFGFYAKHWRYLAERELEGDPPIAAQEC